MLDKKIVEVGQPQRGDVVVFRYPVDPSVDYIKRVVGVPGDVVQYRNKVLSIHDVPIEQTRNGDYFEPDRGVYISRYTEQLGKQPHDILLNRRAGQQFMAISDFPFRENWITAMPGCAVWYLTGITSRWATTATTALTAATGFVPDEHRRTCVLYLMNLAPSRIGKFQ